VQDEEERKLAEEQAKFAAKLDSVFDVATIPYVAAEARQKQLEAEDSYAFLL